MVGKRGNPDVEVVVLAYDDGDVAQEILSILRSRSWLKADEIKEELDRRGIIVSKGRIIRILRGLASDGRVMWREAGSAIYYALRSNDVGVTSSGRVVVG